MRVFLILPVLLAFAYAAPQYGYRQPDNFGVELANNYNGLSPIGGLQHPSGHRRGGEKYLPPGPTTVSPLIRKQFYVVSAPEDEDNTPKTKHLVLGRPQRNYRVVFIKAPNSNAGNIKYSAEFAPQEEKTVIYVLSKKDNALDASNIATPAPTPASKPEVFFIKYKTDEEAQQAQKEIQDGWHAFRDSVRLQFWEYRKALVHLQAAYGIFPYYKVAVENRFNKPHDYIITLDEGEIGLPDKYFYNRDQNDEIVRAYMLLLRDFAINMGIVSGEADLYADEVFHYEKRIVNHMNLVTERSLNEIKTLAEMKTIAPSLPILETLQALFPRTKITEETEVLVKDVEFFHQISTVVATSDKKPINNFIVWSLARNLLPHLSREYRNLIETFDSAIYGRTATYPRWMICSKIVKQWLPFAVDFLQQKRELDKSTTGVSKHRRESSLKKTTGNDELIKLMYYTLRNQLQQSIDEADWIDNELKHFINEKLTTMRLQIGIPEEVLTNKSYIKDFYNELLLNNIFFVDHLQSMWSFRKAHMEEKLKALNIIDTIISEMYSDVKSPSVAYSNMLNMLVISRSIAASKYYDYRYPIAVNFARIGTDILEVLIDSISTFVEQFKADNEDSLSINLNMAAVDINCLTAIVQDTDDLKDLSETALKSFHITLSAAKITAKALSSFISAIDSSSPIIGASFDQEHTYESLRLTERLRLPGLRSFNENELFTLTYMQKHCSTSIADKDDYARIKPHVEQQLAEKYLFNATWNHIQFLRLSTSCSVASMRCSNIL